MASALPKWDLTQDFYKSPKKLEADLCAYEQWADNFTKKYKGKLEGLTPKQWVKAIDAYHFQVDLYTKIYNYVYLLQLMDVNNTDYANLHAKVTDRLKQATIKTQFFQGEITVLSDEKYEQLMESDALSEKYRYFLESRKGAENATLSDAVEKALSEVSDLTTNSWYQYWEKIDASLRFRLDERDYTHLQIRNIAYGSSDETKRKAAFESYAAAYKPHAIGLAQNFSKMLQFIKINTDQRGYSRCETEWNMTNEIYDENIMDRMPRSVKNWSIEEKYYHLKAQLIGKRKLEPWDIKASLPDDPYKKISWKRAEELVVAAYDRFDPRLGEIARRAFSEGWIDARPRPGKYSGSFCASGSKESPSYILINYRETFSDLVTLAHEMGHLVAIQVAAEAQGNFLKDSPSFILSEVTATFGEELLFRELESRTKTDVERRHLLIKKLENSMSYLHLSHAYEFVKACQKGLAEKKDYKPGDFSSEYVNRMKEAYGGSMKSVEKLGFEWMTDDHFFYNPYYLGDYPAASLIVHHLFSQANKGKIPDFQDKWYEMLQKGGTDHTGDLLKSLGLNIENKDFWDRGLERINAMIEQLKTLLKEERKQAAWVEKTEPKHYRRAGGGRGA